MSPRPARQAVYSRVAAHLRKQGRQSLGADGSSRYRGLDGRRCSIGIFLPDRNYDPAIEGRAVNSVIHLLETDARATVIGDDEAEFLTDLQLLHDVHAVRDISGAFYLPELEKWLGLIAVKWHLNYEAPKNG